MRSPEIVILIKQGQHVNTVLDSLLRSGFELVEKSYTHAGRELRVKLPPEHLRNAPN